MLNLHNFISSIFANFFTFMGGACLIQNIKKLSLYIWGGRFAISNNHKKTKSNLKESYKDFNCYDEAGIFKRELYSEQFKSHSKSKNSIEYKLHNIKLDNDDTKQLELLLQNATKDILKNSFVSKYVWINSGNNEVKYFNLSPISPEDGACALASIYKIVGSNETGKEARSKAVEQLKDNLNNPIIKLLIKSEIRGVLLSDELIDISGHYDLISPEEYNYIMEFKNSRHKFATLGEKLKIKYFGHQDLPVNAQNTSYAKLFIDGVLDNYCNITIKEKMKLVQLQQKYIQLNDYIETIIENMLPNYIDRVVAKSGFWLGVANKSAGVMGAIAQINQVNFRVLTISGNFFHNMQEVVNICQHISVPDDVIHNIYLHTSFTTGYVVGVPGIGMHFDLLQETIAPESFANLYLITMHNTNFTESFAKRIRVLSGNGSDNPINSTSPRSSQINSPTHKVRTLLPFRRNYSFDL